MSYSFIEKNVGVCPYCQRPAVALLTPEQAQKYEEKDTTDLSVFDLFPDVDPDLQMMLMTKIHPLCWANIAGAEN